MKNIQTCLEPYKCEITPCIISVDDIKAAAKKLDCDITDECAEFFQTYGCIKTQNFRFFSFSDWHNTHATNKIPQTSTMYEETEIAQTRYQLPKGYLCICTLKNDNSGKEQMLVVDKKGFVYKYEIENKNIESLNAQIDKVIEKAIIENFEMKFRKYYDMKLKFTVDISNKTIDDFSRMINNDDKRLIVKDAFELTIEQTVPFVPSAEDIKKYEEALKSNVDETISTYTIRNIRFIGYEYIYPRKEKTEPTPKN